MRVEVEVRKAATDKLEESKVNRRSVKPPVTLVGSAEENKEWVSALIGSFLRLKKSSISLFG